MTDPMGEYLSDLEKRRAAQQPPGQPQPAPADLRIPYVEPHAGPRRTLVLHLVVGSGGPKSTPPVVGIDGRQYVVVWGSVAFEIPADRRVHVSVHLQREQMAWAASTLLPPGPDLALTYEARALSGASLR
ncbi:MAG TPA: hypothetical protein VGJ41_16725 [Nocardioides sp.]|jgi:hypothetical protein